MAPPGTEAFGRLHAIVRKVGEAAVGTNRVLGTRITRLYSDKYSDNDTGRDGAAGVEVLKLRRLQGAHCCRRTTTLAS